MAPGYDCCCHPLSLSYTTYSLQRRRDKDKSELQSLKADMGDLEKSMSSEIKRRIEMSKSFQSVSSSAVPRRFAGPLMHTAVAGIPSVSTAFQIRNQFKAEN